MKYYMANGVMINGIYMTESMLVFTTKSQKTAKALDRLSDNIEIVYDEYYQEYIITIWRSKDDKISYNGFFK